ncbi:3-dehydroquinate synthase [bioreactor metagenome]|uniref:3-dehydroquinate synthase n=1 Tax=bioreactor metagenome TaxID=1076179 RepID=A0A644YF48_9ZZZZ
MTAKSTIRIGNNKSPVIISDNLLRDFKRWWQLKIGSHKITPVIVLVDDNVGKLHQTLIGQLLQSITVDVLVTKKITGGEKCKQFEFAGSILSEWIDLSVTRDTVLICIGGGTLTDLGGFLSSVYKRGLRTVFLPTTLMAMTDASLGGKNALNAGETKNQIGTINFPQFTMVYPMFLETLPAGELHSGYAEIMKHACLDSRNFIQKMLDFENIESPPSLQLLSRSIRVKMNIVNKDPLEKQMRMWLNLGHTFGHAYESFFALAGQPVSHGHAVAIGLSETLFFSVKLTGFNQQLAEKITRWLKQKFTFDNIPGWQDIAASVLKDKKNTADGIRMVLLESPGKPLLKTLDVSICQALHQEFILQ